MFFTSRTVAVVLHSFLSEFQSKKNAAILPSILPSYDAFECFDSARESRANSQHHFRHSFNCENPNVCPAFLSMFRLSAHLRHTDQRFVTLKSMQMRPFHSKFRCPPTLDNFGHGSVCIKSCHNVVLDVSLRRCLSEADRPEIFRYQTHINIAASSPYKERADESMNIPSIAIHDKSSVVRDWATFQHRSDDQPERPLPRPSHVESPYCPEPRYPPCFSSIGSARGHFLGPDPPLLASYCFSGRFHSCKDEKFMISEESAQCTSASRM